MELRERLTGAKHAHEAMSWTEFHSGAPPNVPPRATLALLPFTPLSRWLCAYLSAYSLAMLCLLMVFAVRRDDGVHE